MQDATFGLSNPRHGHESREIAAHAILDHVDGGSFDNGALGELVAMQFQQISRWGLGRPFCWISKHALTPCRRAFSYTPTPQVTALVDPCRFDMAPILKVFAYAMYFSRL